MEPSSPVGASQRRGRGPLGTAAGMLEGLERLLQGMGDPRGCLFLPPPPGRGLQVTSASAWGGERRGLLGRILPRGSALTSDLRPLWGWSPGGWPGCHALPIPATLVF